MSTKHTPGPWHEDGHQIISEHGYVVAVLPNTNRDADSETTAADARLIAAAPDLMEAMKLIFNPHNGESGYLPPDGGTVRLRLDHPAVLKARAAIAKATGEQA